MIGKTGYEWKTVVGETLIYLELHDVSPSMSAAMHNKFSLFSVTCAKKL
jgi:hypothetical protein